MQKICHEVLDHLGIKDDPLLAIAVELEKIALERGSGIAIGHPYPETFDVLETWFNDARSRGFSLIPITQLAKLTNDQKR